MELINRFVPELRSADRKIKATVEKHSTKTTASKETTKPARCKSDIIENLSSSTITDIEKQVLEKGLNVCPTTILPNQEKLLDDLYFFCRKLRLKEFFYKEPSETVNNESSQQLEDE